MLIITKKQRRPILKTIKNGSIKKLVFILLILINIIGSKEIVLSQSKTKENISDHWANNKVVYLIEEGIIKEQNDEIYKLDDYISREEVDALISRIIEKSNNNADNLQNNEQDKEYKEYLNNIGLSDKLNENRKDPTEKLTRAEFAVVIDKCMEYINTDFRKIIYNKFSDIKNHWAENSINNIARIGLIKGTAHGKFNPDKNISRAEVYTIIARIDGFGTDDLSDSKPFYISHAGGNINGITNTKEGILDSLSKGNNYIEVDFMLTSDYKYILLHDWYSARAWMGDNLKTATKDEFINCEMSHGLTMMDLDMLIDLMEEHPELVIITDTKEGNDRLLMTISYNYPEYMERFIVQIYEKSEYFLAKELGFKDIIFSLYQVWYTDRQILDFAKNNELYAVTMADTRAKTNLAQKLSDIGVTTYTHTINNIEDIPYYINKGIDGFYTDFLCRCSGDGS